MTKLEAWKAWCESAGTPDFATEFTLEQSSHGKAFSFAWERGFVDGMQHQMQLHVNRVIKTWSERCEEHPDHQERIITERMIQERMQEEIDELRQALETEQEPFEYWNAVEGWVKIDEVREHFDAVGCGTIYKSAGEGRSPLYTSPPKREWVGLTEDEVWKCNRAKSGSAVEFHICNAHQNVLDFAEAIADKLREKNHG